MMRASRLQWAVLLATAVCVGCDDGNPFDYVPVSGKLSYDDGAPIPAGGIRLRFYLQDVGPIDGAYPRPGMANVDQSGNFPNATSYNYGDGLTPGKHKVSLDYATDAAGKLLIPKEYAHPGSTPLVIEITEASSDAPLEIKVPRP